MKFAQSFYDDKTVVVEEFLEGVEHSMELVVYQNKIHVLAISDKEKMPFPYRVDKSVIYPTIFTGKARDSMIKVAREAVKSLGITVGAVHIEMCTTKKGPRLFELGARFGGGHTPHPIVSYLTGINVVQEVTRILLGEAPTTSLDPQLSKGCVYRFLTPQPGIFKSVYGFDEIRTWDGILDSGLWVKHGDEIRPVRIGGDRAGYIVAGAKNRQSAIELANCAENSLIFNYEKK